MITISINESLLEGAFYVFFIFAALYLIHVLVESIIDSNSYKRQQKLEKECKPYYLKYHKLLSEEKYKEANEFYDKHKKKIQEISYY